MILTKRRRQAIEDDTLRSAANALMALRVIGETDVDPERLLRAMAGDVQDPDLIDRARIAIAVVRSYGDDARRRQAEAVRQQAEAATTYAEPPQGGAA